MIAREQVSVIPDPLCLAVLIQREGVVVVPSGELDLYTSGQLRECLTRDFVLESPAVRMDLTEVTFMDSTAIGVIVSACKRVINSGGTFTTIGANGAVRRTLEIYGLMEFLKAGQEWIS
jgi:anti-sigma B factor antagonist